MGDSSSQKGHGGSGKCGKCCRDLDLEAIQKAVRQGTELVHDCGRLLVQGRPPA